MGRFVIRNKMHCKQNSPVHIDITTYIALNQQYFKNLLKSYRLSLSEPHLNHQEHLLQL